MTATATYQSPPETIIYRRCYRCGIDVEPKSIRRLCWDCHDREQCVDSDARLDRIEELWRKGLSQRQIASTLRIHRATVGRWVTRLREEFPEVEFEQSLQGAPPWVREIRVDARRLLERIS